MLSLYTPTGSNPAGLTCMELTLKSLGALTCKNVSLRPEKEPVLKPQALEYRRRLQLKCKDPALPLIPLDC